MSNLQCGFYVLGLTVFLCSMKDGQIGVNEALIITSGYHANLSVTCLTVVAVYFVYVGTVAYGYLTSLSGQREVAGLKRQMVESNLLMNNSGTSGFSASGSSKSSFDAVSTRTTSASMERHLYLNDLEQQQSEQVSGRRGRYSNRSYDDEEEEEQTSLLGSFELRATSNEAEDVETAVPSSVHANAFERTMSYVNTCIASPIQYALSWVLPQLHPRPTSALIPLSANLSLVAPEESFALVPPPYAHSPVRDRSPHSGGGGRSPSPTTNAAAPLVSADSNKSELVPLWRAVSVLVVSILCIGLLASAIVTLSEALVRSMGVDTSTLGATLVALGAEIPDTISSIAMARSGFYDGAIAGAIGSQVINISLGVGLPALFVGLTGDGFLTIAREQSDSLFFLTCLLFVVIASYVAVTVPVALMLSQRTIPDMTSVGKAGAVIQVVVWCSVYVVFIYSNESTR